MDHNHQLPQLLDVQQVAELLNASTRHVTRLVDAGKMPRPLRLGTLCRWPRKVIDQWINDGCPAMREGNAPARQRRDASQTSCVGHRNADGEELFNGENEQ